MSLERATSFEAEGLATLLSRQAESSCLRTSLPTQVAGGLAGTRAPVVTAHRVTISVMLVTAAMTTRLLAAPLVAQAALQATLHQLKLQERKATRTPTAPRLR